MSTSARTTPWACLQIAPNLRKCIGADPTEFYELLRTDQYAILREFVDLEGHCLDEKEIARLVMGMTDVMLAELKNYPGWPVEKQDAMKEVVDAHKAADAEVTKHVDHSYREAH